MAFGRKGTLPQSCDFELWHMTHTYEKVNMNNHGNIWAKGHWWINCKLSGREMTTMMSAGQFRYVLIGEMLTKSNLLVIIRPHHSTTYIDAWSVGRSVGLSVTSVSPAKTAAPIEMPFWVEDSGGPKEPCIRWGSSGAEGRCHGNYLLAFYIWSHWCHPANTTEPSMCGRDAALCQITLTTC